MSRLHVPLTQLDLGEESADLLVIGSLVTDISCIHAPFDSGNDKEIKQGSSNPARISQCIGGVAHNIALAAHYLGVSLLLVSVIADDPAGQFILQEVQKEGLSTEGIIVLPKVDNGKEVRTGQYVGMYNTKKSLLFGMADVELMTHLSLENRTMWEHLFKTKLPTVAVLDTTMSHISLDLIITSARNLKVFLILEPVSVPRATKLFGPKCLFHNKDIYPNHKIDLCTPNSDELQAMSQAMQSGDLNIEEEWAKDLWNLTASDIQGNVDMQNMLKEDEVWLIDQVLLTRFVLLFIPILIVTLGEKGCLFVQLLPLSALNVDDTAKVSPNMEKLVWKNDSMRLGMLVEFFSSTTESNSGKVVSVNGAGDTLTAAVASGIVHLAMESTKDAQVLSETVLRSRSELISLGQRAASRTLQHQETVSPQLADLVHDAHTLRKPR